MGSGRRGALVEKLRPLLYPFLAISAGLAFSLVTGSVHWDTLSFWATGGGAYAIVAGFHYLTLSTLTDDRMTPARFLYRTMLIVITMQMAFALIYHFASTPTSYLARGSVRVTDFVDALYFSGSTLLTVGYGDVVPMGDFRFTAIAEVYGGTLFIFSFFTWGLSVLGQRHFERLQGRR